MYFCNMRWICSVLSIWVLLMSYVPCADEAVRNTQNENPSLFLSANYSHSTHEHNNNCDLCSPFCICACCGGFSIYKTTKLNFIKPSTQINSFVSLYKQPVVIDVFRQIWHPPKV